jgi:hypothetical protein
MQVAGILDLGTRWGEWSASRPDHALPPGKDPLYPLYRRLGGTQSRYRHRGYSRVSQPGFREMSLGVPREIVIEKKNKHSFF